MELAAKIVQAIVALGILNVWLLRFGRNTEWRSGEATNMKEEFAVYGLPAWSVWVVGFIKIAAAVLLITGVWVPVVTQPAAYVLAALMLGAVAMHVKVKDPARKSLPALTLLVLSLFVATV